MHSNRLCFVDFSTWDVTSVGSSRITGPTVIWYNPACYYTHLDFFLCQFWGFYSDEDGRILDFQCSCILSKWLACIKRKRVAFQLLLDHFDLVTFLRTIHYCHHSVFYHLCNGTVIIHRVLTWKQDNRVIYNAISQNGGSLSYLCKWKICQTCYTVVTFKWMGNYDFLGITTSC